MRGTILLSALVIRYALITAAGRDPRLIVAAPAQAVMALVALVVLFAWDYAEYKRKKR